MAHRIEQRGEDWFTVNDRGEKVKGPFLTRNNAVANSGTAAERVVEKFGSDNDYRRFMAIASMEGGHLMPNTQGGSLIRFRFPDGSTAGYRTGQLGSKAFRRPARRRARR